MHAPVPKRDEGARARVLFGVSKRVSLAEQAARPRWYNACLCLAPTLKFVRGVQVVKAIIFDIDGTLVDSVDLHARAWQEAFAHFGKHFAFDDVRYQIGKGGDQLLPVFLSEKEIEEFGEELTEYRGELFKREYFSRVVVFPRVRELFERVLRDGKKIALASSAKKDELKEYKRIANIEDLVEEEASADDAEKSKPHPDIFEAALEQLGDVEPSEAIVVGDTPYDAEAALKAGLRTVGVLSGGFPEEDLRAAGCVRIYKDVADILANYDTSPLASETANAVGSD